MKAQSGRLVVVVALQAMLFIFAGTKLYLRSEAMDSDQSSH